MNNRAEVSYSLSESPSAKNHIATMVDLVQFRPIVLVVGMPRSGMSLCAHILSTMGIYMTDEISVPSSDARNQWERREIVEFHDRILRLLNRVYLGPFYDFSLPVAWWADPRVCQIRSQIVAFLNERMGDSYFGFKDPRTMRLMPIWHYILNDLKLTPKVVLCLRSPSEVARSLKAHDGVDLRIGEYRSLIYMMDFFRYTKDLDVCVIDYEGWFNDPLANFEKLGKFLNLRWQQGEFDLNLTLSRIIDPALNHGGSDHRKSNRSLVYQLYELASHTGLDGPAREDISNVVSQLINFEHMQRPLQEAFEDISAIAAKFPEFEQEAARLRAVIEERDQIVEAANARASAGQARSAELEQEAARLRAVIEERDQIVEAANARASAGQARSAEALQRLKQEAQEHDAAVTALRNELAGLRYTVTQAEREAQQCTAAAEASAGEVEALNQRLTLAEGKATERAAALEAEIVTLQGTLAAARQIGKAALAAFRIDATAPAKPTRPRGWRLRCQQILLGPPEFLNWACRPRPGKMTLDLVADLLRFRRKESFIGLADRARDAGQWEVAVRLYGKALDRKPYNPPIWVQYGHALKESGELRDPDKLAQAELAYRKALALDPGPADMYLQLGHVLKLQGRTEEAKAAYLRALALDPSMPFPPQELLGLGWPENDLLELRRQTAPGSAGDGPEDPGGSPIACQVDEFAPTGADLASPSAACANDDVRSKAVTEPAAPTAACANDDSSLQLFVDRPVIVGNKVLHPIHGGLLIEGWAWAPEGVATVDIAIDGEHSGTAKYGLRRKDVGNHRHDWESSHLSGYALVIPTRALATGEHFVRVALHTCKGRAKAVEFSFVTDQSEKAGWKLRQKMARSEIELTENILSGLGWRPLVGILVGLDDPVDILALDETLRSLRAQAYDRWHAAVACKGTLPEWLIASLGREFPDLGERLHVLAEGQAGGFVDTIALAIGGRRPDLVGVVSAGDILGCDALLQIAVSAGLQREGDFFYTDERRTSPISGKVEAFLKPQWSPDLLFATNYVGRLWCADPDLLDRASVRFEDWCRFGEYDLILRCTEAARKIRHIPRVLCERGTSQIDDPAREREALARAMQRRAINGELRAGCAVGYHRVLRRPRTRGLVSIIIPIGGNVTLLRKCLSGIFERTAYQNFELIIVPNAGTKPEVYPYLETIRGNPRVNIVDSQEGPFNFSRICNRGAAAARGEFLLFLNDDIEVIEADWLDALIQHAERREVGAVGARLLYPDGKVQHAGVFWTGRGGRHAFRFASESDPGYFGLAVTPRNVIAVTGACIMMRRNWFEAIGRFDENHPVINNDVDICLRCWSNGGLIVYEPAATLIHHELASRHNLADEYDVAGFEKTWKPLLTAGDPYYHPNLTQDRDDFSFDDEPAELVYAGHPLFCREEIQRILILKLDHLGDFITSLPAMKRLHNYFPEADLYLLAPPGSGAFVEFGPGIREVIKFEFFHSRSGLGELELSLENLTALQRQLAPYRFDLAIDLRKHLETRNVLRLTGARWLAGYDRNGRFPWLDIALEWEGDDSLIAKRSSIGDDLCRLVDAVALAANPKRQVLRPPTPRRGEGPNGARRLVCIHPGVGNEVRQWPPEHYATLIDLLALNHGVDIVLIGSADEREVAAEVMGKVRNKWAVQSLVGASGLAELPALLASAALFVGNNSGPQHIAAQLGVPTIGIHSGVVNAREWGPTGPKAVAIQRNMRCSPCYISKLEQCPRGLSCLTDLLPSAIYQVCAQFL
jgi:ADP-heptose:LPS heptosyltransferase/GT2 family glycosyltransferase